jgi:hypothetical protein
LLLSTDANSYRFLLAFITEREDSMFHESRKSRNGFGATPVVKGEAGDLREDRR